MFELLLADLLARGTTVEGIMRLAPSATEAKQLRVLLEQKERPSLEAVQQCILIYFFKKKIQKKKTKFQFSFSSLVFIAIIIC